MIPKISDFPNFNRIELRFGLRVDLGFDFKVYLKRWIKREVLTELHHSIVSIDGHHGTKERYVLELLDFKNGSYNYTESHNIL